MLTKAKTAITGIATAALIAAGSFAGVPTAQAETAFHNGMVQTVAWNGKGKWRQGNNWHKENNWRHNGGWNNNGWRRHNGNNWVGPAIGFGTGLFIGSMLAHPRVYAQPRGYNHDAYCHQIHPSYKSWSGTYTTYSGREVPC